MTRNRTIEKFELYVLSLWLLFFLIIVITINIPVCFGTQCVFIGFAELGMRNVLPVIALFFVFIGVLYYFRFDYKIAGSKSIPVMISSVEDVNYEHLTFLTTYIIPLICFKLTSDRYLIALGLLLMVVGVIYVKTDKFYVNPTLAILGFRLYSAVVTRRTGQTVKVVLISKDRLQDGSQIQFLELDSRVYYAKRL
ncbi:MAG: anti-phage protein KwaA [Acidithiobacillus ferrivorans]